jgi:hypothetical protein
VRTNQRPSDSSPLTGHHIVLPGLNDRDSIVRQVAVTAIAPRSVSNPPKQLQVDVRLPRHRNLNATLWFQASGRERRLTGLIVGVPGSPPSDISPEITSEALRSLSLRKVQRELDRILEEWAERDAATMRLTEGFRASRRPGRRGREDYEYAAVAEVYVKHLRLNSRAPVKETAAELHYSVPAVRALLNKARKRGLLTEPDEGRAGGTLTKKARRELAKHAERH